MQIKRCRQRIWKKKTKTFAGVGGGREEWGIPEWHWKKHYILQKVIKKHAHIKHMNACMNRSLYWQHTWFYLDIPREKRNGEETTRPRPALWTKTEFHTKRRGWALCPPRSPRLIQLLFILPEIWWLHQLCSNFPLLLMFLLAAWCEGDSLKGYCVQEQEQTPPPPDSFLQTLNAKNN